MKLFDNVKIKVEFEGMDEMNKQLDELQTKADKLNETM